MRTVLGIRKRVQQNTPRSPTRGKSLAVVGSFVGAGSAGFAAGCAGTGRATTTKIGISCLGGVGGGGVLPDLLTSYATTVTGTSVTLWAETLMPFLRPHASVSRPSTMNL